MAQVVALRDVSTVEQEQGGGKGQFSTAVGKEPTRIPKWDRPQVRVTYGAYWELSSIDHARKHP